jgi:ABC-2 type transport system permease protein
MEEIKKFFMTPKNLILLVAGPLFFTFLFGMVYRNDYLNDIPTAILDMDKSANSRMLVTEFEQNDRYSVKYFPSNTEGLRELIENKKVHAALFIPPDFDQDIKKGKGTKAALFIDGSNIAIGNNALSSGLEILNTVNGGIHMNLLQAKGVPPRLSENYAKIFEFESRVLWDPKLSYKYYIIPGIVIMVVQQLFLSAFTPNFVADPKNILEKSFIHAFMGAFTYLLCLFMLENIVGIHLNGNPLIASGLMGVYLLCLIGISMVIGSLLRNPLKVTQFCMMLSVPTMLTAGYIWPSFAVPKWTEILVKIFWPLTYILSPIRDFLIKGRFPEGFITNFMQLLAFGLGWAVLGYFLMKKQLKTQKREESEIG